MQRFLLPKTHRVQYARDVILFGERRTEYGTKLFWNAANMLQGHADELAFEPPPGAFLQFSVPKAPNIPYANRLEDPAKGIPIFGCLTGKQTANILIHAQIERSSCYIDSMLVSRCHFLSLAVKYISKWAEAPCVQRTLKTFPWAPIVGFTITINPDGQFPDPRSPK